MASGSPDLNSKKVKMKIIKIGNSYHINSKKSLKNYGFHLSPLETWETNRYETLIKVKSLVSNPEVIENFQNELKQTILKSKSRNSKFEVPAPLGLEYYPFQKAGIEFICERPRVLLADEMGLGKSIEIIGAMNILNPLRTLIICPAGLRFNWEMELRKWLIRKKSIQILRGKKPLADINIISYAMAAKYPLQKVKWSLLVCDESHFLKSPRAKRTRAVVSINAKKIVCATGTPVLNRPIELHSTLSFLDPTNWPDRFTFAHWYCNAYRDRFGWNFTGASNLSSLRLRLRSSIMIRRTRKEVLPDLPSETHQIILLRETAGATILLKQYNNIVLSVTGRRELQGLSVEELHHVIRRLDSPSSPLFSEISKIRRELAEKKLKPVIEHLGLLLESGEKVVVFAHHRLLLLGIKKAFPNSVMIIGGMKDSEKHKAVEAFQNGKAKLFVGSIQAAGVGITLTASHIVAFAESSWTPGEIAQAKDRCVRIGQKNKVLIQYLVTIGSPDVLVIKRAIEKQRIIQKIVR